MKIRLSEAELNHLNAFLDSCPDGERLSAREAVLDLYDIERHISLNFVFVKGGIGIDGAAEDIHAAYLQANRAWRAASHSKESIVSYETLSTELLLDHIPRKVKADYLRKLYPGCSAAQLREFTVLLEAYFAAEGSLNAAADVLFVHKNTLQYRLKRLAEITGLDVRKPSNAPALYMAVLFFRDLENEEELLL